MESASTQQLPDDDFSQSPVSKLPVECLISIFSLLPIADRVRIQRVCKHWQGVSFESWSSCKTLSFKVEDWGCKYWIGKGIDQVILKNLLELCGPHLTRIDFSEYYDPEENKLMKNNESLFVSMKDLCPNLTAIDIRGLEVTAQGLECLGKSYSNLTEFAIGSHYFKSLSANLNKPLSLLFRNNKNLQRLMLHVQSDGNCLSDLNPTAIKEISVLHGYGGERSICSALKRLINLRSFSITNWANNYSTYRFGDEGETHMNEMLKAIEPSSENLQELTISSMLFFTSILSKNFESFGNLQKLVLEGDELEIIDFNNIVKYCAKLTCVDLNALLLTDLEIASIMQLPKLQELHLSSLGEITDAIFMNHVSSLEVLDCFRCPLLTNVGFRSLLKNSSESLRSLTVTECRKVNLNKLIQDAKEATDTRSAGSVLKIFVDKRDDSVDESTVQKKRVTKLSEHLELTENLY